MYAHKQRLDVNKSKNMLEGDILGKTFCPY